MPMNRSYPIALTVLASLIALTPIQSQSFRGRVTLESGDVVEGSLKFRDAVWVSGDGTHRLQAPSNSLLFIAQGSAQMVQVSLAEIDSVAVSYVAHHTLLVRSVHLLLTDGTAIDGVLPSAPDGGMSSRAAFTNGVLVETGRLVVREFQLPSFASTYIPLPPAKERVAAFKVLH
jgi:hypothetical protein